MVSKVKATVFIPTWFGEELLDEVLKSVFSQKVPFKYEVLIYDTSSTDKTPEIIKKYAKKHSNLRHKTITKEEFGHGKTRNAAAHDAKGEIVVYISQDVTPAHNRWLYEIVKPFDISPNVAGVIGKQDPRANAFPLLKNEIISVFRNMGPDHGTTVYYKDDFIESQSVLDAVTFYSDVNSAARREYLIGEIPYKDVPYAEDQLLGRDMINAGFIKAYAPRANVLHSNNIKLREYKYRMFDETLGLRRIGIPVEQPSRKSVVSMIVRGSLKDTVRIVRDRQYSWKRKLYWLVINPIFHIEKWRGVRLATGVDLKDEASIDIYSLERLKNDENTL
jgi:rhamnosyltransferase